MVQRCSDKGGAWPMVVAVTLDHGNPTEAFGPTRWVTPTGARTRPRARRIESTRNSTVIVEIPARKCRTARSKFHRGRIGATRVRHASAASASNAGTASATSPRTPSTKWVDRATRAETASTSAGRICAATALAMSAPAHAA